MEIGRSLNRSWIYDTYFSLNRAIHPGEKSGEKCLGEMPGYPRLQQWLLDATSVLTKFPSHGFADFTTVLSRFLYEANIKSQLMVSTAALNRKLHC